MYFGVKQQSARGIFTPILGFGGVRFNPRRGCFVLGIANSGAGRVSFQSVVSSMLGSVLLAVVPFRESN